MTRESRESALLWLSAIWRLGLVVLIAYGVALFIEYREQRQLEELTTTYTTSDTLKWSYENTLQFCANDPKLGCVNVDDVVRAAKKAGKKKKRDTYCFFAMPSDGAINTVRVPNFCVKGRWKEEK